MLDISGPDFLVLIVAALFILGPERIPGAARWLGRTVRQVREYATGARDQMESELGSDLGELREPLQQIGKLRNFDRGTLTRHLLDATGGYDPRQDLQQLTGGLNLGGLASGGAGPLGSGLLGAGPEMPQEMPLSTGVSAGFGQAGQSPLTVGERPPFDPDAT